MDAAPSSGAVTAVDAGRDAPPEIEFSRPTLVGDEIELVAEVMRSGDVSTGGPFTREAEALLGAWHHDATVLLTTSCTAALELAAMTLDLGPGDVVAVPSFTFPTTASAFARTGARLRFVDIEPTTLGMDPDSLARSLDDSVSAVVPVHYGGTPCDI
ncbi:MAG: aminotransferase class I/II-fold pyridoxal phosphate-dependent enzyme, partial [Microthrixaceae bacterium]|nr:aminotransferase class I/II-fold pyridoxal phosphate-dependent enzyme [Microthrixaceae bacterium]